MRPEFPELKSQEEIDREQSWNWFKWYFVFSTAVSLILVMLMIAALVKYVFY